MSSILAYGPPGSGKTTLFSTFTKLGYKVLYLDLDQKVEKMINLRGLLDSGDIVVKTIEAKLTEVNLKQRILTPKVALVKQPKGYLEFCDLISEFESMIDKDMTYDCQVLVIDSITALLEHLDRLISHLQQKKSSGKKDHWTFDEWAILLTNLEEFFYTMLRLQKLFKHVGVIAHVQTEKDETSGRVLDVLPQIKGSMRFKAAKYFEEVYLTHVEASKAAPPKFQVITKPIGNCHARTSRDIPTICDADFSVLFKEEMA